MNKLLSRFAKDESGATAIEYGLIAGFISLAIIIALPVINTQLERVFTVIGTELTNAK